jgi:2-desacetyl-2-hydroxyethyl bacteriochlorophyllide A dehydrogenase
MLAVTFQHPGEVRVDERPEPELLAPDDAIVRVEATAVCGSDLHIYHGRHPVEPGFVIGHEFVGEVVAAGDDVDRVAVGDRVIGCFLVACGRCFFCQRGLYHLCDELRIFGHGEISGNLPGAQAEQVLVPHANLVLRRAPADLGADAALFAGDVMNTGFHGVREADVSPGETVAVLGMGPVGLCAVQAARHAGAERVIAVDSVPERLEMAREFGAEPVHLTEEDPRAAVKAATEGRGVDACVEAVGSEQALDLAIRLTRKAGTVSIVGVHGQRCQVHMGLLWNKGTTLRAGVANVIGHVDEVLELIASGELDPSPIVTHHLPLESAP